MKKKAIPFFLCFCMLLTLFSACGKNENTPKDTVGIDEISAAITAEMKKDLMDAGGYKEEDFATGGVPSYQIASLKDEEFQLPLEYDQERLEDALMINHQMNVKSDMIVVMKAKSDEDVAELENYAKKLRDDQYKTWERYLPDQFEKVQQNVTKTVGHYVIYVTYDEPQKIADAIENLLK